MSKILAVVVVAVALIGCGGSAEKPEKVRAFQSKVSLYLDEARAGAKLLSRDASMAELEAIEAKLSDLNAHLPDVPTGIDQPEKLTEKLERIETQFALGKGFARLLQSSRQLGDAESTEKTSAGVNEAIAEIKSLADEIEALLSK